MCVGGITTIQKLSRREMRQRFPGKNIKEICSHLKRMVPKGGRNRCMSKESANHVVNGANFAFRLAVL